MEASSVSGLRWIGYWCHCGGSCHSLDVERSRLWTAGNGSVLGYPRRAGVLLGEYGLEGRLPCRLLCMSPR